MLPHLCILIFSLLLRSHSLERSAILTEASTWLTVPYLLGGSTRTGIDSPHFTHVVYNAVGLRHPYCTTRCYREDNQVNLTKVPRSEALRGDVIIFDSTSGLLDDYGLAGIIVSLNPDRFVSALASGVAESDFCDKDVNSACSRYWGDVQDVFGYYQHIDPNLVDTDPSGGGGNPSGSLPPAATAVIVVFSLICVAVVVAGLVVLVVWMVCRRNSGRKHNPAPSSTTSNAVVQMDAVSPDPPTTVKRPTSFVKGAEAIDYDSIIIQSKIGRGGSGAEVLKVEYAGETLAMKLFVVDTLTYGADVLADLVKECTVMCQLHHPNLLRLKGTTQKGGNVGILMKFCENGDMKNFLLHYKRLHGPYSFSGKIRLLAEIAEGMSYLHSQQILHRDLKPENVLIDENEAACIMDFGLARIEAVSSGSKTGGIGTSMYMAPEVTTGHDYGAAVDVFSFSMVLVVVVTDNYSPYELDDLPMLQFKVANTPDFRPSLSQVQEGQEWLRPLISSCWKHDPVQRPSFAEIVPILRRNLKNIVS